MYLRNRFGIPGVIAVIALVFAMLGGAYAATNHKKSKSNAGLTAKQTKEVKKLAQQFAGVDGAPGATGPVGPSGQNGHDGGNGSNGSPGSPGAPGKSVELVNEEPLGCFEESGFTYEVEDSGVENEVCNGEPGVLHPGETLPLGATETGTWSVTIGEAGFAYIGLSFPIPLEEELDDEHVKFMDAGDPVIEPGCTGGTPGKPKADPGYLCVYTAASLVETPAMAGESILKPNAASEEGAGISGAVYQVGGFVGDTGFGTYAVTAEPLVP